MSIHGDVTRRAECPSCGSTDNVAVYEDNYEKCFGYGCEYFKMPDGERPMEQKSKPGSKAHERSQVEDPIIEDLPARGLTEETAKKWSYEKATVHGKKAQVANYYKDGKWVCAKVRFKGKEFRMIGDGGDAPLYGQHLWRDGGKHLVIVEGEIDAMSVSQIQGHKWPVVSLPSGAGGAVRSVQKNLEFVEGYDRVVLMFDGDEPGQQAARDVAELLTPGKAHIAQLPLKDANEMLKAGRSAELISAFWDAKVHRPDGIVSGADLWDDIVAEQPGAGIEYPWSGLNEKLLGIRPGELVTVTAGSGIGKSTFVRQLAHHLGTNNGQTIGYIGLEESTRKTALELMSVHAKKRWSVDFRQHADLTSEEQAERKQVFDEVLGTGRFHLYDHFGSTNSDSLLAKIRYLIKGCGARFVVLDHLSIVVSAMDDDSKLDERKLLDKTMTKLRTLVEETGAGLILVSHLRRPGGEGKGWERGREVALSSLRGSAAIEQLSDVVLGLERDQQQEGSPVALRVLKNRPIGRTGIATYLKYDEETGLYEETEPPGDSDAAVFMEEKDSGDF